METSSIPPPLPEAALEALHLGKKLHAIKLTREAYHLDFKEARDRVDHYIAHDPHLRAKLAEHPSSFLPCGCVFAVLLVILAGVVAFLFLRPGA